MSAVLATIEAHLSTGLACRCGGWKIDTKRRPVDPRAQHREHIAEVVQGLIADAVDSLADEADLWADESDPDDGRHEIADWLRTRSAALRDQS